MKKQITCQILAQKESKYEASIFYEVKKLEESGLSFDIEVPIKSPKSKFLEEEFKKLKENLFQKQTELEDIKIELQAYKENYQTERIENLKTHLDMISYTKHLETEVNNFDWQNKELQEKYDTGHSF